MTVQRAVALAALVACACAHPKGAAPPTAPPGLSPGTAGAAFVAADVGRASAAGAGPARIVAAGAGAPGDNLGNRVDVDEQLCALFLARGGPTLDDLDLFVYSDDGTILGSDEAPVAAASVIVCPPHPQHVYAFGRVAAGHGLISISAQLVQPADAERVRAAVSARGAPLEGPIAPNLWPGLEDALAAHRRDVPGTWRDVRRVAVPLDPRTATRLSAVIEAGQCVDLFSEPADDVAYTELSVVDVEGRILGQVPAERRRPALVVCSKEHAEVTFSLRPHGGRGLAAVVLSVASDVKTPADGVYLYEAEAAHPLDEALAAERTALGGPGAPVGRGTASVARRESLEVELPRGCARLDVVSGAPLRGLDAFLWSVDGALVAHDDGPTSATLFACSPSPSRARLDVEAVTRGGPFAIEMRAVPGVTPALEAHPLAAGRVLHELSFTPSPLAGVRTVEIVPLTSTAQATRALPLGRMECVTVVLGLGPGAEGAELRLVDTETSAEVELVRGTRSAITRTCGAGRPRALGLELRVAAGSTDALLAVERRAEKPPR